MIRKLVDFALNNRFLVLAAALLLLAVRVPAGGRLGAFLANIFLLPIFHVWMAGNRQMLSAADADFSEAV